MKNRIFIGMVGLMCMFSLYGCGFLIAGAAGGAGTAVWLANKLSQEVDVPMAKATVATKSALNKLNLEIVKEVNKDDVSQFISKYYEGQRTWVDIHKTSEKTSRIEVRVGLTGDEDAARKILDQILDYV